MPVDVKCTKSPVDSDTSVYFLLNYLQCFVALYQTNFFLLHLKLVCKSDILAHFFKLTLRKVMPYFNVVFPMFCSEFLLVVLLFVTLQFPGAITDSMKSLYFITLVYTPGAFFCAHSRPQLTIPTNSIVPSCALATKGPPESP